MEIHECEGCKSYYSQLESCIAIIHLCIKVKNIDPCPCTKCLIKPMCITMCKVFEDERD